MRWLISCASMLYEGEQTLLNELTLLLANLLVALWRVARCPTAADRLLAADFVEKLDVGIVVIRL